jgi:hypothetical protein
VIENCQALIVKYHSSCMFPYVLILYHIIHPSLIAMYIMASSLSHSSFSLLNRMHLMIGYWEDWGHNSFLTLPLPLWGVEHYWLPPPGKIKGAVRKKTLAAGTATSRQVQTSLTAVAGCQILFTPTLLFSHASERSKRRVIRSAGWRALRGLVAFAGQ